MVRIKMRVALKAVGLRGRWTHWNSWKGWLYLALLVFISGRLFVSQGFSLTLTPAETTLEKTDSAVVVGGGDNINSIAPKNHGDRGLKMAVVAASTWSSSPVIGHGPKSQEEDISGNQLHNNNNKTSRPLIASTNTADDDSRYWNPVPSKKSHPHDVINNETSNQQRSKLVHDQESLSSSSRSLEEKERRYWLRSERIKRVCRGRGVVSNPLVFATSKNETRPVRSPNSKHSPVSLLSVENPVTSHFSMAPSFQTMGCFLNKVASSSLVSAFLLVHGLGPTFSSPHSLTSHLLPRSLEDFQFANQTFFKFMFVRHPMDRMLSCYLDKMVESPHYSLPAFRNYVKNKARQVMMKRQRAAQQQHQQRDRASASTNVVPAQQQRSSNTKPHQARSLLSLIDEGAPAAVWNRPDSQIIYGRQVGGKGYDTAKIEAANDDNNEIETKKLLQPRYVVGQQQHSPSDSDVVQTLEKVAAPLPKTNITEVKPTFEEFLEFVLDTDLLGIGYDSHWVPFHRYCSPCSVPYHVIGKLETAADDFQYIWDRTGLGTQVPVPWINRNTAPSKSKIALEKKYYSSLPRDLILRFYDAFRMDFELFDYSINDILVKAGYRTI